MDEPKVGQDPSQAGDPSGTPAVTSEQTPETFTKESQEKAVQDSLSAAGRDAKSIAEKATEAERILTDARKVRADTQAEQKRWQDERDEADREAVRSDPEALKSTEERIRQRNERAKLANERAELSGREAKHQKSVEKVDKVTKEHNARDIASKHNVDAESLIKFTDGSKEAMEELAKQLPKKSEKPSLKTDPGTTIGAGEGHESAKSKIKAGWDDIHKT